MDHVMRLFRLYWIPFLPSADLAKDGQPKRIRLLGEDLVAFRDTEGRVGLVDQACPHRGAPLIFGLLLDRMGLGVLAISAGLSLAALLALLMLKAHQAPVPVPAE